MSELTFRFFCPDIKAFKYLNLTKIIGLILLSVTKSQTFNLPCNSGMSTFIL